MTAQLAMAAVYPPEVDQQWDDGLGKLWQPVPYTAVPLAEDYVRFFFLYFLHILHKDIQCEDTQLLTFVAFKTRNQ